MGYDKEIYLPDIVGKGYGDFWRDRKRYRVLKGGKGSKKSTTTALNYIYRMSTIPDSNLLVVRAVQNTHKDSTFAQLRWAISALGQDDMWTCTVNPLEITYNPTGQKILFRGFDDVYKLASTTVSKGYLCWAWIEEAFELPSEADFDKFDMSVPRGEIPDHLFKQTTLTFNPWSAEHWLKKRFFDKEDHNVSTYTTNYLCNEFLDETDIQVFERMKKENPRKFQVAGLGDWGIADGLVYDKWEVKKYKWKKEDDYKWSPFFGLDFGYTNDPTAFIGVWVNPIDKEAYIYDEFSQKKLLNSDIAEKIIKKGYGKERIRADAAEPKSIEDLRRLGLSRIYPSVKGRDSIINGIEKIQEYQLYVDPCCKETIAELSSYCWETKNESGINKPVDKNNHLMDALRYAFYDVQFFFPKDPRVKKRRKKADITCEDVNGGWGG